MSSKLALMLCISITLAACGSAPQIVPAACPSLPVPPVILTRPLPTMDLLEALPAYCGVESRYLRHPVDCSAGKLHGTGAGRGRWYPWCAWRWPKWPAARPDSKTARAWSP